MRNRLARWVRGRLLGNALRTAVECVLLDHCGELDDEFGKVDANLAELAVVYERLTGWTAAAAWAAVFGEDTPTRPFNPEGRR